MSFLHIRSSKYIKSERDLFSLSPMQTSIENSQWIYYKPVTSLADDSPIEFIIPGHGELSRSHSHHVEFSHMRRKRTRREHIGRTRRQSKSRTRKLFTAFHVQPTYIS